MKVVSAIVLLCFAGFSAAQTLYCDHPKVDVPQDFLDMVSPCITAVKDQVQEELKASIQYLAMAAHFSRDVVNRPGFAHLFFEAASEEREHAIKLIEYLLMRGELVSDVSELIKPRKLRGFLHTHVKFHVDILNRIKDMDQLRTIGQGQKIIPPTTSWTSAVEALKDALRLEASVTDKIHNIMKVCEEPKNTSNNPDKSNYNDYHIVDYLTSEFLEEQYRGQREIAGRISTLDKFMGKHGTLGEFLYDKDLLKH